MTNEKDMMELLSMSCGDSHGYNCPGCDTKISKIVAESMRLGEVKAWEEAMQMFRDEISQLTVIYGTAYIPERFLLKVGAKLTELKK